MLIPDSTFIAPNSTLIGNIILGEESSIWFGCVLRGDNDTITIGAGSNIQDLSMVHVDPGVPVHIGSRVTIGHRAIIHGCFIDDNTLIGMGAIVMNRARIGKFCIIGAGALVPEGMEIPDYSVVMGVPGKVVKEVTQEQTERIRRNAESYMALAKRYKSGSITDVKNDKDQT